ncbi:MAG TPA: phosphoethanolamine--lipid A transferase [Gammaproteobacteria bacterium]|nr:phosphoethanolamine--lipid A transferase [Gammaproteobacteria bacterium]
MPTEAQRARAPRSSNHLAPAGGPRPQWRALLDFAALPVAIAAVAAFIVVFDNDALWRGVLEQTRLDDHRGAIVVTIFVLVLCTISVLLALVPGKRPLRAAGGVLLVVAAICGYFMAEYGVIIDASMIRNIAETKPQEASPLLTMSLLVHVAAFGVAPALALWFVPLPRDGWRRGLAQRAVTIAVSVAVLGGTLYANYGAVAYFGRQYHEVRLLINPTYPLYSLARFWLRESDHAPRVRQPLDARVADAHRRGAKPTLLVMVVGETARADRWSFNGYERDTNRYTRPRGVVSFGSVTSCGTSTADSVPCLFSDLGHADFTHPAAASRENLFGLLDRLGVGVFWRDNSTGCKEVCDPMHFEEFAERTDEGLCDSTGCFDEVLLRNIDSLVADTGRDHLIVLHQRGSHGPAYHTDVPAANKEFLPECDLPSLRNCNRDLINNAYDNTILYTDFFLSRVIDFLEGRKSDYQVALLYVSDHGESLGENGLYLHGLPYAIAPHEQTRVPMLFWASPDLYQSAGVTEDCVRAGAGRDLSHDWIFHTVLPLFGVESSAYNEQLDVLASCRGALLTHLPAPAARRDAPL